MMHNYNDIQRGSAQRYCAKRRGCAFEAHFFVPFAGGFWRLLFRNGVRLGCRFWSAAWTPGIRHAGGRRDGESLCGMPIGLGRGLDI